MRGKIYPFSFLYFLTHLQVLRKVGPVWQGLDHPNILPFFGIDADLYPHMIGLVSPWMQHGTVLQFLEKNIQNISVEQLVCSSLLFAASM
jgi:hypothetical protein